MPGYSSIANQAPFRHIILEKGQGRGDKIMDYMNRVEILYQITKNFLETKTGVLKEVTEEIIQRLKAGRKILVFGNGGSAAEAQHFAAELVNKFLKVRPAIRAVALTTDTSILTSIGNDASFDNVFSRQIEALGDEGDAAVALSTSGTSPNTVEALKAARERKMVTVAITGEGGGKLGPLADYLLAVPSKDTPRIQEVHLLLLHLLAEEIEARM